MGFPSPSPWGRLAVSADIFGGHNSAGGKGSENGHVQPEAQGREPPGSGSRMGKAGGSMNASHPRPTQAHHSHLTVLGFRISEFAYSLKCIYNRQVDIRGSLAVTGGQCSVARWAHPCLMGTGGTPASVSAGAGNKRPFHCLLVPWFLPFCVWLVTSSLFKMARRPGDGVRPVF